MKHRSKQRRQAKLETPSNSNPAPIPIAGIAVSTSIVPDVTVVPKYQPKASDVKNALAILDLPVDTKYDDLDLQVVFAAYKNLWHSSLVLPSVRIWLYRQAASSKNDYKLNLLPRFFFLTASLPTKRNKTNHSPPHKVAMQVTFLSPLVEEVPAASLVVSPTTSPTASPTTKPALPIFAAPIFEDTTTRVSILEPMIVDLGPEFDEEPTAVPSQPPHFVLDPEHIDGATIRQQRELCGFSLDDLAAQTKIRKNYLQAIEVNDATAFASRVYLRGFLTQIARVLKVDKDVLADGYLRSLDAPR